ncbi:MAG: DUF3592 domain-containing protein [Prosthecobacter sp.]|uniref:DUF3592 domain-containing protein n=1 Tax=Prosthecobacter sp. TaxID=1965333 RepID=UPI0025DA0074|nr:DUF3592 domain-containing protein [Prosthecobacter sp.]MCF7785275.1 DUF3592 domain-containing protein [Prosthecobacter sp.]
MTQKIPVLFLLLPLVFVIVGGWLSFRCARGHVERFFVSSWPTTSGRVTDSSMESTHVNRRGASYEVKVMYEYSTGVRTFTGTRIHPTYVADWHHESHEELLKRLSPHSTVRVSYHPNDPSRSYLACQFVSVSALSLLGGLMFLGAGLAFGTMMLLINYGNHDYASLISTP